MGKSTGIKHGKGRTRLYRIWSSMKNRCKTEKSAGENYHARGIRVCDEWQKFMPFYEWAISAGYESHLTIDRINNDGNYEPTNCRWATYSEQNFNKRKIRRMPLEIRQAISKTIPNWKGKK